MKLEAKDIGKAYRFKDGTVARLLHIDRIGPVFGVEEIGNGRWPLTEKDITNRVECVLRWKRVPND